AVIPVKVTLTGATPPSTASSTFTFVLQGAAGAPMPASDTITIDGTGSGRFGPIAYTVPNTYSYTLYQVGGSVNGYTYDATAYDVKVYITSDNAGNLSSTVWLYKQGTSTKQNTAEFANRYQVKTDIPKTGYDNDAQDYVDNAFAWLKDLL
ncbi:MAG: FctA domain-containing protein, partial [Syntrophomonadaceae bacterium]|nr:FctA domain-containing protein [Syntrophomonadaceae bacterium]